MTRTLSWVAALTFTMVGAIATIPTATTVKAAEADSGRPTVYHGTMEIEGLDIFYREAGDPSRPTLLLLHGFPTSSHMFRNLIPALADEFHVIAPDYPGYGNIRCQAWTSSTIRSTTSPTSSTRSSRVWGSTNTACI